MTVALGSGGRETQFSRSRIMDIVPVNNLIVNLQQKNKALHDALELLSQEQAEEALMIHEAERKRRFLQEKKDIYEKATGDEIFQIQKAKRSYLQAEQTLENLIKAEEILKMYDKKLYEAKMKNHDLTQNLIQLQDERTNAQMEYLSQGFPLEGMLFDIKGLNDKNIKILSSCTERQTEEPPISEQTSSIKYNTQKDRPNQYIFTSTQLTKETHLLDFNDTDLKKKEINTSSLLSVIPVVLQPNSNSVREVKKKIYDFQIPLHPNHSAVTEVKKRYNDVMSPIYRTYFKNFVVAKRPLYSLMPTVQGRFYPNRKL